MVIYRVDPINDHIITQNTIRFYVFWGIKYGSTHTNRAGTSLPRKGVNNSGRSRSGKKTTRRLSARAIQDAEFNQIEKCTLKGLFDHFKI